MKYNIRESEAGIDIDVIDVGDKQQELLTAFQACQSGQCSCPTDEYEKLDAFAITEDEGGENIHLHLSAKPGMHIESAEIDRCLSYTVQQVESLPDDQQKAAALR